MDLIKNQKFKMELSQSLGTSWIVLGRYLSVSDNELEAIKDGCSGTVNQAYEMLTKWTRQQNSTLEELKEALSAMKRFDLKEIVEEFAKSYFKLSDQSKPCDSLQIKDNVQQNRSVTLKKLYLKRYEIIDELQPPLVKPSKVMLADKFIELCIVDAIEIEKDIMHLVERDQFFRKQISYIPISFDKVFVEKSSSILISGIAGIGKTWLLRKCLLDWSNNLIWTNVSFLFYLECSMLNQYQNVSNLIELLNVFYKDILKDFDIFNVCEPDNIMFIIDGLDEFMYLDELIKGSHSKYNIVNIFAEIKKYKTVIAGRVSAISLYQNKFNCNDQLTVQVLGFNDKGINDYIESNFVKSKEEIFRVLKESSITKAMASVPFFLSSICTIVSELNKIDLLDGSNLFVTTTDLYGSIFLYFFQRHIDKRNEPIYKMIENESTKKYILNVCKIAYCLFKNNKVVFSEEEIKVFINDFDEVENRLFGFIERIETHLGFYYQFVHMTIMEFCASVYAYNFLSWKEIVEDKKLNSCLTMICGLLNKKKNSFLKFLANLTNSNTEMISLVHVCDLLPRGLIYYSDEKLSQKIFIECFYESQASITDLIKPSIDKRKWYIKIRDGKTSYEIFCEKYFVSCFMDSSVRFSRLLIYKDVFTEDEKDIIIKCSMNVCHVYLYCPFKIDKWVPNQKIEVLAIDIRHYLISKKDFENFLPWFQVCNELNIILCEEIDFLEYIYECIRCLNLNKLMILYRGKSFCTHEEFKKVLNCS
ncbi:NACHT, LRR and PYD domains-containing protein 3 isoform X2 [Hydra vulgaris]|nr:NACHT, LRR and PYD domains-containing protein 3 isoform X2 [Hydra vulgaris]